MRKWADQVGNLRATYTHSRTSSRATVVPNNEFYSLRDVQSENPYLQHEEEDDDEDFDGSTLASHQSFSSSGYPLAGNESQSSFRSRSTTGESSRGPPVRYHMGGTTTPVLSLRTTGHTSSSPEPESFFSPVSESPISTRSSGFSNFSRGGAPISGQWGDEHRYTAPAMPRHQVNSYQPTSSARGVVSQRPSLPPNAHSTSNIHSRMRSASSPDIANPGLRNYQQGQAPNVPPVPDLPPYPAAYSHVPQQVLNRSQSTSPAVPGVVQPNMPIRSSTQSPSQQHARLTGSMQRSIPSAMQPNGASMAGRGAFAAAEARIENIGVAQNLGLPAQLKVKVHCEIDLSTFTLVVSPNITFQTLKDRIDVKLQRSSSVTLSSGKVKLKYLDEDDYISIQSDEDVQMAFETWRDSQRAINAIGIGEIDLYIQ
jgi:cell division control protein 24